MDEEGISMEAFKDAFEKGNMFASGIGKFETPIVVAGQMALDRNKRGLRSTPVLQRPYLCHPVLANSSAISLTIVPILTYLSLIAVDYGASVIVAKSGDAAGQGDGTDVSVKNKAFQVTSEQALARKIEVGKRMPSVKVLNQADARPSHFQELLKSNGRWRLVIFPGDISISRQKERLDKLGQQLAGKESFLKRFTPPDGAYDSTIELLTVHSAPRATTTIFDFPEVFRPYSDLDGWDYWKIFVDDESYHEGHGQLYQNFGIDPQEGCAVILRPDQYVSYVGRMGAYEDLDRFFSSFMVPQKRASANGQNGSKPTLESADTMPSPPEPSPKQANGATMVL